MKKLYKFLGLLIVILSLFFVVGCKDTKHKLTEEEIKQNQIIEDFLAMNLIYFAEGDDKNNVYNDISLVTNIESYRIFWSSNNKAIVINGNKGNINPSNLEDITVALTATIIVREDLFKDVSFNLVVKKQEQIRVYSRVTLDLNGGTLNNSETVIILEDGMILELIEDPVKEGYNFIGWTLNGIPYDFSKGVYEDITLIAQYEKIEETYYTVILDPNGGTLPMGCPDTQQILMGNVFKAPADTPTKDGYTFVEWRLNGVKYDFTQPITSNITLVAEYVINSGTIYKLTLPSGVTADVLDPNNVAAGTDITLNVSPVSGKDVVVFINGIYHKQDDTGVIEVEVTSNLVVETKLVDQTQRLFDVRKLSDVEVNIMGIITGIIPDNRGSYIYINDETAAIIYYSTISPQLKVGDLVHIKGGDVNELYNNKVVYPKGVETILKSNQPLPPAVYAQDVSHGTLDYKGLSLQAQRFNIENLSVVEKPLEGKSKNFLVEDQYGNQVQIRVHKYLTDPVYNEIWDVLKDLQVGDQISLEGAHLGQYQKSGQQTYIIQFMLSSASEIVLGNPGVRHAVTFKLNTGEPDVVVNIVDGKTILQSSVPMVFKPGFKFIGWYQGTTLFDFNTPIIGPITLTAKWEESQDPVDPTDPSNPNNQAVINNQKDPKVVSYYQGINFQESASSLQQALKKLVSKNAALGYDAAKSWLLDADRDLVNTDKLRGIYDQALFKRAWDSAATWNREHVWPQSKLGSAPKGEAHNLRVSGTGINRSRGNYPFGENSSSKGNLGYIIGNYWWPGNIDKGDVARITMFMNLRYGLRVTNNADIKVLYKWHIEDPVDAFEIQRNNVIHSKQGNRNPFIDHPEIFAKLYELVGGQIASAKADTEIFLQTNISYSVIMTNINIGDLNRKQLVI